MLAERDGVGQVDQTARQLRERNVARDRDLGAVPPVVSLDEDDPIAVTRGRASGNASSSIERSTRSPSSSSQYRRSASFASPCSSSRYGRSPTADSSPRSSDHASVAARSRSAAT